MLVYDISVSAIENYTHYCLRLKESARALVAMVQPSTVNSNGRMGSDEAILRQLLSVKIDADAVEMMEKTLGVRPPREGS